MDQTSRGGECQYCWTFKGQHEEPCPEAARSERMKALRIKVWWYGYRSAYKDFCPGRGVCPPGFWGTSFNLGWEKAEIELSEMEAEAIERHREEEEAWIDLQIEIQNEKEEYYED